jgi:alpha-L-rhamnosidase
VLESERRNERQRAYRVVVRTEGDVLWDSGRVESDRSVHVVYAGKPLLSHTECRWQVRAWDRDGEASEWSEEARWSMGLLEPGDWEAEWVGMPDTEPLPNKKDRAELFLPPCPYFRREFSVRRPVKRATVYATALGLL